jgi:hypothetical protein
LEESGLKDIEADLLESEEALAVKEDTKGT